MLEDMKITVCFGATKIIVPCGSELPVRELVQQAIVRYRKVTNKHADDYIRVHCLQTCDEGAILDEDDTVGDVLDDRDKIIASFEENLVTRPGHNGGDGTSTSSVGTASPDIFQGDARGPIEGIPIATNPYSNNRQPQRILDDYKHKNSLQVKYVEGFSPHSSHSTLTSGENHEATRENGGRHLEGRSSGSDYESVEHGDDDKDESDISAFKREPARKSLKSDHLDRWMDMQESYSEFKRHEPTGAPPSPVEKFTVPDSSTRISRHISLALSEPEDSEHLNIVLKPTMGENLGITVQGYKTADGSELGLIVFEIDPKSCAARDGRVQVADRIVAVNNQDLTNVSNERAEEAFSKALQCDTIELSISRSHSFLPENQSNRVSSVNGTSSQGDVNDNVDGITDEDKNTVPPLPNFSSPTYKKPLATQDKNDVAIPRIVEKKIVIDLQKGSDGLGFSVTSRDNPAGGACPIYVKNILPHGAAIRDGQLQAGDQILEVDGTEMTGKSQEQAVNVLRSTKGQVKLLIQRKITVTSPIGSKKLIKDLERAPSDSRGNKILTYQIPLPSSGTAGLGITVKGKSNISEQNESSGDDLGIFVKTVVPGGAAHQDGRLRPNDQLISVNGVKLTGMSNSSAMKTLRSAMETKTLVPVEVTVIRSVKEIMNNVSELETIRQQKNTSDRAIDVGGNGSERIDVPDGALGDIKEIESSHSHGKQNQQGTKITDEDSRSKPDELKPSHYHIRPASDDELRRGTKQNEISHDNRHQRRTVSDDELKHRPTNRREQNDEMKKLFAKPVLNENSRDFSSNRVLNGHNSVNSNNKVQDEAGKSRLNINTTDEDKITELKPSRVRQTKAANGIHRNPSYYIAMNRTGQRAERLPKSKKPKSPFYQPKDESHDKDKEPNISRATKEEKPKIVIASFTDTARVWNTTRPMSITNRPSSTVAEPTSALSTSASATLPRSSDQSRASLSPPRDSKRPPTSINIPKGTPPPPPPRTQRPSPYTKQFPNYLLAATAQPARKSDSTFSDYSDNSDVSPAFQNPKESSSRESSAKVVSATEVKSESKNDEKPNVSAQNESKVDDVIDYLTDDEEDGTGEHFVREGMGRQSMSEKRFKLAQADITQTEFYKQRVTRTRSLEGALEHNVNQGPGTYQTKTLPRPSTTPIEKSRRPKSDEEYNERLIDFTAPIPKERSKKSDKESLTLGNFDPNNVRGQWRTSSDGVVKKYGRHGNYIKASPLASMANNNFESVHIDGSHNGGDDAIPITMQSNADYSSVHPKVKKKTSGFNLKNLGAALKPKAYKGKYDMQSRQTPESPSEPAVDIDEQRYRQLVLGKPRERSLSETLHTRYDVAVSDSPGRSRRKKQEQQKRPSPTSLQDILRKGSGEYSITESAQI